MCNFATAMRLLLCTLAIICAFTHPVRTQEADRKWRVNGSLGGGFIIPHHPEMRYLVAGHVHQVELNMYRHTDGSKDWHHHFNFPTWGLSTGWYGLRSPELGYAFASTAFMDMPLNPARSLGLKMGIGTAYVSHPFNAADNFFNTAIGSHLNATLSLEAHAHWVLGRVYVDPGIALHHFSNGAMRMPNSGINMPFVRITAGYLPGTLAQPERRVADRCPDAAWRSPNRMLFGSSIGAKEILPIGGRKYHIVNVFAMWMRRFSPKSSYGVEGGINYNGSLSSREESDRTTTLTNYRAFVAGQYQLHFDPWGIRLQAGSYLFPTFTSDGYIFFRYHLVYNAGRVDLLAGLKSHFAKADNIEIGAAYRIKP